MEDIAVFLKSEEFIDADHIDIKRFAQKIIGDTKDPIKRAVKIYQAVRDGWLYVATKISFREEDMRASNILKKDRGHCIEKAVLMIACCRAVGIPARLCLAKVKNHIAAERVEEAFGIDELVPHGYVEVYLEGKWVKATPAFNQSLCEVLQVGVLEFNGRDDSLFQEYDKRGGVFMEYLDDYGCYEDVPLDFIIQSMRDHYPALLEKGFKIERGAFIDLK